MYALLARLLKLQNEAMDVISMGKELVASGVDGLSNGGFWIWDIKNENQIEFYSPKFRESLGFENETDFPNLSSSWQNQITNDGLKLAVQNYEKALETDTEHPYVQNVVYRTKQGEHVLIKCSGILVRIKGNPKFLIGSHQIIAKDGKPTRKPSRNSRCNFTCGTRLV